MKCLGVMGSKDGGKTWREYSVNKNEKSLPVDLSAAAEWIFAMDCVYMEDGKFFRKEIRVKP